MHEETEFRPKPLVPVGDMPMLWHVMQIYAQYGYRDFVLCLGYKGQMIKDFFLNFENSLNDFTLEMSGDSKKVIYHNKNRKIDDWKITFVDTGEDTQTGGRLARVKEFLGENENFFLTYADGVGDVKIPELYKYHQEKGKAVTLCGVNHVSPFGIIEPRDGLVNKFTEKPRLNAFINGGFYVMNKKIFEYVNEDTNCVLEKEPMQKLASAGQLAIYPHNGFWHCIDHLKHLEEINSMFASGNRPWMTWEHR
jgi:glucose-1-phosphate cytidylyltransferase